MIVARVAQSLVHREDVHILEVIRDANTVGLDLTLMEIVEDPQVDQEVVAIREVALGAVIVEDLERVTEDAAAEVLLTMIVELITSPDSIQMCVEEDADRTVILETIAISEAEDVMIVRLTDQGQEGTETDTLIVIEMTTDHIVGILEVVHLV